MVAHRNATSPLHALCLLAAAALAIGPVACAGSDADDPVESASGEDEEIRAAKPITEADNGKTIDVPSGKSFAIRLASNPTTGYRWQVQSVDRSLGYPKESFKPGGGAVGSGGMQRFVWSTKSPFPLEGEHKIVLVYQRPWAENAQPAKTFSVTVDIGSASGPTCGLNTCAVGEVCCNASCGICTPPGGVCSKHICVRPQPPPVSTSAPPNQR